MFLCSVTLAVFVFKIILTDFNVIYSKVVFIFSSYYAERVTNYLPSWQKLVKKDQFEYSKIKGNHYKLFVCLKKLK